MRVKRFWACVALVMCVSVVAVSGFAEVKHKYFRADKQVYDVENDVYLVSGNIVIPVENGSITGDKAKVKLSTMEFWGTGGWMLKQYDVTFKGESAYVMFNKDAAQIEGGCDFQRPGLQIVSDKAEYNWKTKVGTFTGRVRIVEADKSGTADSVRYNVETKEFVK